MKKTIVKLFILLLFVIARSFADDLVLDLETGLTGFGGYNTVQVPKDTGSRFSLTDDLGLSQAAFYRIRVTKMMGKNKYISVLYAPLALKASGISTAPLLFNGDTFAANTELSGTYRFDSYRVTYYKKYVRSKKAEYKLGFTAKIRDAAIKVSSPGLISEKKNTGLVPLLHFGGTYAISPLFSIVFDADALAGGPGRAEDALFAFVWKTKHGSALRIGYRIVEGGADVQEVYNFALLNYLVLGFAVEF